MTRSAGLLIVIQPHQRDLYDLLRRSLKDDAPVTVIYDRRLRERRRGSDVARNDRRRADRRQRRPTAWLYTGMRLPLDDGARPVPDSRVRPARKSEPALAAKPCPECGVDLEFELPRFPQPPGRVDTAPIHGSGSGPGPQHYVEIQAFSVSGRPLLVHRTLARTRG